MKGELIFVEKIKILQGDMKPTPFANKCGVDPKSIISILKGRIPTEKVLQKVADKHDVSIEWFFTPEDKPNNDTLAEPEANFIADGPNKHKIISKLDFVVQFIEEIYGNMPTMANKCIQQINEDLRKNPDFRQWEYEQEAKMMEKRKAFIKTKENSSTGTDN